MKIIHTIKELRSWRALHSSVALVPTMGNLHEGHLSLVREAAQRADDVVVSVFVNRLQFGINEDFDAYPRTLASDAQKLEAVGVSVLFAPDETELYPHGVQHYTVDLPDLQNELCGRTRPGHFKGAATVVLKLFNIVQPQVACFGKKDFQQLTLLRNMTEDLNLPISIVPVEIARAEDGLALSSRNGYLSTQQRAQAPQLNAALCAIARSLQAGETHFATLEQSACDALSAQNWQVDYVEIRRADDLKRAQEGDQNLVILAAAKIGDTRLIDNIEVHL